MACKVCFCLYVQMLLDVAKCYPRQGASCLSVEYAWRQLMPGLAALARGLCVAVEAWPPGVPEPQGLTTHPEDLHAPLGMQYMVRPPLPVALRVRLSASFGCSPPCAWSTAWTSSVHVPGDRARCTPLR